mgnify:CR=1 FL=1
MVSITGASGTDMNAFTSMVTFLDGRTNPMISKHDYEVFQKEYIFDKLKGYNYGKAFCKRFDINDRVIECLIDEDIAREMIAGIYIQ